MNNSRRYTPRRIAPAIFALGLAAVLAVPSAASGALVGPSAAVGTHSTYQSKVLAKAVPDECFVGVGLPYPPGPPCAEGQAKVNQVYVWGLARAGKQLWFGTGPNVHCLTSGRQLNQQKPVLNDDYVCEYGSSQIIKNNPDLPLSLGDHRQPDVFVYDTKSKQLTSKTDVITGASETDARRLMTTAGIRAAGTHHGVVLLAGPSLGTSINMFAFDGTTGEYLGSNTFSAYGNIRSFVVADDTLYAGVGVGANGSKGGYVLRWTGDRANPFNFEVVGQLPSQAANITVHKGRLFTSTWSATAEGGAREGVSTTAGDATTAASVFMSPPLSQGARGLTTEDVNGWQQVWSVTQYEPDAVVAATYGLGALASYGGYLYWGTLHVPYKATAEHLKYYPPKDDAAAQATTQYTQRAAAIFRGKDFGGSKQKVELLYGSPELPAFDPAANDGAGAWVRASTGYTPKYGLSGFDNRWNTYTWSMAVAAGKLFVGTMDWSTIAPKQGAPAQSGVDSAIGARLAAPPATRQEEPAPPVYGADLMVFESTNKPAKKISDSGLGNYLSYGVRNMVVDGSTIYLGMANPANLRTDPTDDVPEGGWELIELKIKC